MAYGIDPLLGPPTQYYGRKRRSPSYGDIIGQQSGPALYALKALKEEETERQQRHEAEMALGRENITLAEKSLADLTKYRQQGLDVSREEMTLTKTLGDLQRKSDEAIARRQMEQQESQAKTAQLISGIQTGVQTIGLGYKIGQSAGWWGNKPATSFLGKGGVPYGSGVSLSTYTGTGVASGVTHLPTPGATGVGTGAGASKWATAAHAAPFAIGGQFIVGKHLQNPDSPISKVSSFIHKIPVVGDVAGAIGCIIVTSCTDPDSYEVNITREFRDKHLDPVTLKGYYELAARIVPLIQTSEQFKRQVKETLVDRLIDFGEWFMGYKTRLKFNDSEIVTNNFLNTCYLMGV